MNSSWRVRIYLELKNWRGFLGAVMHKDLFSYLNNFQWANVLLKQELKFDNSSPKLPGITGIWAKENSAQTCSPNLHLVVSGVTLNVSVATT